MGRDERVEGLPCPVCDADTLGFFVDPDPAAGRPASCDCAKCGASLSLYVVLRCYGFTDAQILYTGLTARPLGGLSAVA